MGYNYVVLGAGRQGTAAAYDVLRYGEARTLVVADQNAELARQAAAALPEIKTSQGAGIAYTDALVATQRGLPALTLCTLPGPEAGEASHWHQMSDRLEHVDPQALMEIYRFTWQVLQILDQS